MKLVFYFIGKAVINLTALDYEIIASGSTGNCVRIANIMIDIGVKYDDIKATLYDVDFLVITHEHGDHIKVPTLKKLRKLHPEIKVFANYAVAQKFPDYVDTICNAGFPKTLGNIVMTPFKCVHDVLCYGYTFTMGDINIIYATDTETLDDAPRIKYDYLFIESNYDQAKIDQMLKDGVELGYKYHMGALRHLSKQKSKAFYFMNRNGKDAKHIELHKSKRFY